MFQERSGTEENVRRPASPGLRAPLGDLRQTRSRTAMRPASKNDPDIIFPFGDSGESRPSDAWFSIRPAISEMLALKSTSLRSEISAADLFQGSESSNIHFRPCPSHILIVVSFEPAGETRLASRPDHSTFTHRPPGTQQNKAGRSDSEPLGCHENDRFFPLDLIKLLIRRRQKPRRIASRKIVSDAED